MNAILSTRRQLWEQTPEPYPQSSPDPASIRQFSIIEGNATESGLLVQIMREKSIRVIVNAAGHATMFARSSSSVDSDKEIKAVDGNNEVARIVRASVDAIDEVGNSTDACIDEKKLRGWFMGGMLLLDFPESTEGSSKHGSRQKIRSLDV